MYEAPDTWTLSNLGMAFGKETQTFARGNDRFTQASSSVGVVDRDRSNNPFEVSDEGVAEDYFEVHSFKCWRTLSAEWP